MTCFYFIFKRRTPDVSPQQTPQNSADISEVKNVKTYTYRDLVHATDNFSAAHKLGEGGFGTVYKGKLKDGNVVAVKVLSIKSKEGSQEFLNELTIISNIVHENLVRIRGCCVEGDNRILVYDFVENNSLAHNLLGRGHSNIQFSWRTRTKICIGIAKGLAFLHEETQPRIIHRDIKASNILLDKNLTPKISDFGLAKLLPAEMSHISTRVAGTIGYLAPEYALRAQASRRADVYSFGVLLLEIISGRSNLNTRLPYEEQFLLERKETFLQEDIDKGMNPSQILSWLTWTLHERGELLEVVDVFLNNDFDPEEVIRYLKVALVCTQDSPRLRPSMSTVVKLLTGERNIHSVVLTKPGLISDLMDIKIKNPPASPPLQSSSETSSQTNTGNASFSFTATGDNDRHSRDSANPRQDAADSP